MSITYFQPLRMIPCKIFYSQIWCVLSEWEKVLYFEKFIRCNPLINTTNFMQSCKSKKSLPPKCLREKSLGTIGTELLPSSSYYIRPFLRAIFLHLWILCLPSCTNRPFISCIITKLKIRYMEIPTMFKQ